MRRILLITLLLAVVALGVAFVGPRLFRKPATESSTTTLTEYDPRAQQQVITVRGTVVPVRWAQLSFSVSGQLKEITVQAGQKVSAGEALARLEGQDLEIQVQLAESELAVQEANLARLQEGSSMADIAAAQASYDAAIAAYNRLKAGPSAQEIAIAETNLKQAERAVQQAQAAYDAVRNLADIGARPESLRLEEATLEYERAKATYELAVAGADEAELKQAESQTAAAKARLEELQATVQPSEIQSAQASVAKAKASLAQAQLAVERAVLRARFDGEVTSMAETQPGDSINLGTTIVTVADRSQMQVEVNDLDEWGAAAVTLGQTVDLLVPALNNRSLRGQLVSISSEPTIDSSGTVFYRAIVALEQQDPDLRWGMTVRGRLYRPGARRQ